MAGFRGPGSVGLLSFAVPDKGTLNRSLTPSPGPVGGPSRRGRLSDSDRKFIDETAGRDMSGKPLPLATLRGIYDRHLLMYEQAIEQFGIESSAALFEEATLMRLGDMIHAASLTEHATEQLARLVEQLKDKDAPIPEREVQEAVRDLIEAESVRQKKGLPPTGAIHEVLGLASIYQQRWVVELERLTVRAKNPNDSISDEALIDEGAKIISRLLGVERQKQLLGTADDAVSMDVIVSLMPVVEERIEKNLKKLAEDAKRPDSKVTEEQIQKKVTMLLGIERQRQLLGAGEEGSGILASVWSVYPAVRSIRIRNFKQLLENAKRPGNTGGRQALVKGIRELYGLELGTERQRQLLGVSDGRGDDEIQALLDQAVKLVGVEALKSTPSPPPPELRIEWGPVQITRRVRRQP